MIRYLLCGVVLSLFLIGCSSEPEEGQDAKEGVCAFRPAQELQPGLILYKAVPGDELCGSYRMDGQAVHFQAIRGEDLVFGENTVDPDAPAYAVSVRILDQAGNPIAVAIGDHDERISDWLEKVEGLDVFNPNLNSSFVLAQKAFDVLSQTVTNGFSEEIKTLKRRSITGAPSTNETDSPPALFSTTWRYWIRIFRKDALFNGNFADHSAVIVNVTKPDGTILNYVTCNHGTCADDAAMQFRCQNIVYPAAQRPFSIMPCDSASSYGFTSGTHVCNDDTLVQYNMVVYNNSGLSTCTDSSLRFWAPTCY